MEGQKRRIQASLQRCAPLTNLPLSNFFSLGCLFVYSYRGQYENISIFFLFLSCWCNFSVAIHLFSYTCKHKQLKRRLIFQGNHGEPAFWAPQRYTDDWWSKQVHYIDTKPFFKDRSNLHNCHSTFICNNFYLNGDFCVRDAQLLNSIVCDNRDVIYPHRPLQALTFPICGLQITLM